ncbi:acyltransferase family protein [Bradyrhizobium sp. JYMT SZCCT0180]|uniref:acyltransferase family protein n=1 Tax=Bradyrhizobium sp. JYMT SZCCT0180 TaxID=2807666 RepID=UPI001BA45808|nr:acyltransferase family protein [Bradyrhizobium sp. JYMT SZCCT0180]MBR1213958.1 acyltransferase [Bradyrhizobium sp. JYMT SZCCT0180]
MLHQRTLTPSLVVDEAVGRSEEVVQSSAKDIRSDIQLLRAWAVLVVVLHHAGLPYLTGGFLGVDIFFVISGYLMTWLIDEGLDNGSFTFGGFYARRVRRLLPGAYATFTVTAIAAPLLLDATELRSFVAQLAGAFTFTANVVLLHQTNYFGTEAAMKPLLHVWSLSLEEQYYLCLPIALYLCPRRFRLFLGIVGVVISVAICEAFLSRNVSAAFYYLPSRAWELGIGSVVALMVRRNIIAPIPITALRWACVAVLLVVPVITDERGHPGVAAAVVCLATAVLLVPGANLGRAESALWPLTAVGDRSYSLYLVHWPLFAFASNVFLTAVPAQVNIALLGIAAILTELQYRFVENRFRRFLITRRSVAILLLLPIILIAASFMLARWMSTVDTQARTGGYGLAPACEYRDQFEPIPSCMSKPNSRTLLWGDSFAMALAPGLAASSPQGIIQATKSVCGPLLDLSPLNGAHNRRWSERCARFNESVFSYLAKHPEIDTVVLSAALTQYVPGAEDLDWRYLVKTPDGFSERPQSTALLLKALATTVSGIRRLGKRVILVAPPPAGPFDIGRCLERIAAGKLTITDHPDCTFTSEEYRKHRREVLSFLDQVRAQDAAPLLDLDEQICGIERCQTRLNGTMLYRDNGHLSPAGSVELGREMGWGNLVERFAR